VNGENKDSLLHSGFAFAAGIGIKLLNCYMGTNTPNRVQLLAVHTASASGVVSTAVEDSYILV